jgi:ribosomal protein S14
MLKFIRKNEKQRKYLIKREYENLLKCVLLRFFLSHRNIYVWKYFINLYNTQLFTTYSKTRNICIMTGRTRSVYRLFKLARAKIREYANQGYFVGISKVS